MTSSRPSPSQSQFTASVETEHNAAHRLADAFAERFADEAAVSIVDIGSSRWRVILYFGRTVGAETVRDVAVSAGIATSDLHFGNVAAADWVEESLAGLKPVEAGRFVVHGAHDRARIAPHRIGIEIEAALAFGTGHHGTTRGCLLALDRICKASSRASVHHHPEVRAKGAPRRMNGPSVRAVALRGSRSLPSGRPLRAGPVGSHLRVTARRPRILDLGTGSGVLAIAAARALQRRVLATDLDPQAVRAARDNARRNGVGPLVDVVCADGVAALGSRAPFDLVFANILLAPLQRFATALTQKLAPGARVVLSGILPAQANAVVAAYHALTLQRRVDLDGWTTLVFARAPALPSARSSC
jgi:ribosomal protein L11 methyltransferase